MKKSVCAAFLAALLLPSISIAQDVDWDKYEVGIDLLWITRRNLAPTSFFVKKLELKQKKNDFGFQRRGYRMRVGASYSRPNQRTTSTGYPYLRQSGYTFLVRPGYEWHRRIRSFDIYYGADLSGYFNGSKSENYVLSTYTGTGSNQFLYNQTYRYTQVALSPVVGTTIKIYSNINLTLESTIDFYYGIERNSFTDLSTQTNNVTIKGDGIGINTYPLYTLNVSFSF